MSVTELPVGRPTIRVGVIDRRALVGEATARALETFGLAARPIGANAVLDEFDVIVADAHMADDELAVLADVVAGREDCQLIVVASQNSRATDQVVRQLGAAASFERSRDVVELAETVVDVAARRHAKPVPCAQHVGAFSLTPREIEILVAIADGASNADVAARLDISSHTVRSHLTKILTKLGVPGRLGAVTAARRAGVIPEPRSRR